MKTPRKIFATPADAGFRAGIALSLPTSFARLCFLAAPIADDSQELMALND
jgi:hypothetical protein